MCTAQEMLQKMSAEKQKETLESPRLRWDDPRRLLETLLKSCYISEVAGKARLVFYYRRYLTVLWNAVSSIGSSSKSLSIR